jgi:FkbM family methyltransferase
MKKILKEIFHLIGFDIIRYKKGESKIYLRSKKTNRTKLYNTATGKYYLPEDAYEDVIANTIINNDIYDKEIIDCAKKYIKPGSTVLDIGANYGQMSILFSKMAGEAGKVYSFDADDFVFEILKKNILVNNCINVEPVFGAVHNVDNDVLIFPEQDFERFGSYGSYGIDYNHSKPGREVRTLTIDNLDIKNDISFIKIDIQGGDLYAMKGAVNTIKKNKMPILFEFEYLFQDDIHLDFQEYVDFVEEIGYKFTRVINGQNYLITPRN